MRRETLVALAQCATEAHCASGTAVSLGARPDSDVRATASKRAAYLRMCASKKSANARALSFLGGGDARALPTCARRGALAALAPCALGGHYLNEKPPFLLRKAVLPRASPGPHLARWLWCQPWPSLLEVAYACTVLARHCVRSLFMGAYPKTSSV